MVAEEYHGQNRTDKVRSKPDPQSFRILLIEPMSPSTHVSIREATADDYASYVRLFAELGLDDVPINAEKFSVEMAPSTLIACRGDAVVGYAHYRMMSENAHLSQLVSDRSVRRTGAGRALITDVIRRVRALGATDIALNVRPDNAPAMGLYESCGFVPTETSTHVRMPWAAVDRLPPAAIPHRAEVRPLEPAADRVLEGRFQLPAGTFAFQRTRQDVMLAAIGDRAVAAFDSTFPGAYPFRAIDGAHALSLVAGLRPFARAGDEMVNLSLGSSEEVADALFDVGAILRFRTMRMLLVVA